MNFLAHIVLSGDDVLHSVGNYAGDFVKGRNLSRFPEAMQKGIITHRAIDAYTDSHAVVHQSVDIFYPIIGRYAGIIVDVLYDHFLSQNWQRYSHIPRAKYIDTIHHNLWNYRYLLPPRAKRLLPSLIYQQYLSAYISYYGLRRVFNRMASRTSLPNMTDEVIRALDANYNLLDEQFSVFYQDLQMYVQQETYLHGNKLGTGNL